MSGDLDISADVMSFFENNFEGLPGGDEPAETGSEPTGEPAEPTGEAVTPVEGEEAPAGDPPAEPAENEDPTQLQDPDPNEDPATPDEQSWQDRYKNLQSQKDKEVAQVHNQLAALQQQMQQQYEWNQQVYQQQLQAQQAQVQQQTTITKDQLDAAIDQDMIGTFRWVAENRPDLVAPMASMVREKEQYGHAYADQMLAEFNAFQVAQMQQQTAAQLAERDAPAQVQNTMSIIAQELQERHGENFTALQEDVAARAQEAMPHFQQYMAQNGKEVTPQAVYDFITQVYFDVRESKLAQAASAPRQPQELTPQQHVESSNAQPRAEADGTQDAINEILKGAASLGIDTQQASA